MPQWLEAHRGLLFEADERFFRGLLISVGSAMNVAIT